MGLISRLYRWCFHNAETNRRLSIVYKDSEIRIFAHRGLLNEDDSERMYAFIHGETENAVIRGKLFTATR